MSPNLLHCLTLDEEERDREDVTADRVWRSISRGDLLELKLALYSAHSGEGQGRQRTGKLSSGLDIEMCVVDGDDRPIKLLTGGDGGSERAGECASSPRSP